MERFKTAMKIIKDPNFRFHWLAIRGLKRKASTDEFLKREYRYSMGKELNLDEPKTYTEKLQWLKLHDHHSIYTTMVDKYAVKQYVADKIGKEYVVPLLGVWDSVEEIDFSSLPESFVLKTTHDSGGIIICKDKSLLNVAESKKKLNYFMKRNYYDYNREWPYKNVPHKIIAEKYMEDCETKELRDYKFFTFGGEPKVLYIAQGRGIGQPTVADFYDMEFNHLPFTIDHEMASTPPEKPKNFELMKQLAKKLSEGTPQLRVDFYEVDGKVYFGEMTFFHCSGLCPFNPPQWDEIFGEWLILPEIKNGKTTY